MFAPFVLQSAPAAPLRPSGLSPLWPVWPTSPRLAKPSGPSLAALRIPPGALYDQFAGGVR